MKAVGRGTGAASSGRGYEALSSGGDRSMFVRFAFVWLASAVAYATVFACRLAWDGASSASMLFPFAVFTAAILVECAMLAGRTLSCDVRMFAIATLLSGFGLAVQFRMGAFDGESGGSQVAVPAAFAAMVAAFLVFRSGRWNILRHLAIPCYVAALASLGALLAFGRRYRGGFYLPGNINPTEVAKPLLAVAMAAFLAKHRDSLSRSTFGVPLPRPRALLLMLALWLPPNLLAFALHDLGLVLLLNIMLAAMLFGATRRAGYLLLAFAASSAAGFALWRLPGHVHARLAAWMDPFADPTGSGWQLIQGFSAMFAGGIWGAGLGAGLPVEIPIASSDFVYAAIAEESGMVVCLLILGLYAALAVRGFMAAGRPNAPFGSILATGLSAILASQALLNIGGVVKALPLTGIVLPFLSQGGSGMVTMMFTVGLLAAVTGSEPPGGGK